MYKIKWILLIIISILIQNQGRSQGTLSLLDSIVNIYHLPKGITVYPIDFQNIKVTEDLLINLNDAHYDGIAKSGVVDPKTQMSKKYVKKYENDITLAELLGHQPQNLISTLKVISCEQIGESESDFIPLKSIELLAEHSIYDITTGKKLLMSVLHLNPQISNIKNRSDQNQELSKILTEQIKSTMKYRFPELSYLKSINTIEKDKAISVDIDNTYSVKTNKSDLYVNIIKNIFYINDKPHYQFENIGRVDFDKNIDAKISNYKVKKGKEEINAAFKNNQTLILSLRPLE